MSTKNESSLLKQKIIFDITKFTTTDFANHLSCIVWFAKCNMRCLYCYNDAIVSSKEGNYSLEYLLDFLKKRVGLLDAVVLSGGEASLNNLEYICQEIKKLKYKIKLDTNGLNPKLINKLIDKRLVDYVALDYKAPHYKFESITKSSAFTAFEQSLDSLINASINFEVRTTLHNDLLNTKDINFIINDLRKRGYKSTYYIQHFLETPSNIGNIKESKNNFLKEEVNAQDLEVIYRNEIPLS